MEKDFWKFSFIFMVICIFVLAFVLLAFCFGEEKYPLTTVVDKIENDIVYIVDANGTIWSFKGAEDWAVGDIATCIMSNHRTAKIFDDKILSVKYGGTLENFMQNNGES